MKKKIFLTSIAIISVLLLFLFIYPQTRLPKTSGQVVLKRLRGEVVVTRDKWGVPHIEAENEQDLQRALGFIMAGDRLFQMDILRRIVNGELSEIFGKETLKFDVLLRKLGLRAFQDDYWRKNRYRMDARMVSLMESFLDGVHQYMENHPLPIEFQILGYRPRPFTPQEAMGVSGYLSLSFAEGLIADALYTDLLNELPKEIVEKMWIRQKNDKNKVTQQKAVTLNLEDSSWFDDFTQTQNFLRDGFGLFHGSNSWVLSGKRSSSGYPLLANDPHIAFSSPSMWYEAHLKSPEYEIYGHFIPLVPFAAMGHDRNRGWAITMSEIDDMDLYEEKINDLNQVLFKGKWIPVKVEKQVIKVKGEKDHEIVLEKTPHGPLLKGTQHEIEGKNISLKWSYHHPENDIATAIYKLSHTKSIKELDEALSYAAAPGLSVSWADKEGNIAWRVMGKIPLRKGFLGNQILQGWTGAHEYERYLTFQEHPSVTNPENGLIVTTNYYPQNVGPLPIEGYWQPSERFERIHEILEKKEKWNLSEMKGIQNDQFVVTGEKMRNLLISEVEAKTPLESEILKEFKDWKGGSNEESFGSAVYHMWIHHLGKLALKDELGEKRYIAYNKIADFWNFFKTFLYDKENVLWDDVKTPERETRKDLINKSFRIAANRLKERMGEKVELWTWGKIHRLEFQHPLGKVRPLDKIFNIGPYEVGGGPFQINNMSIARYKDHFDVKLGASVRRLIDFSRPEISKGILPTGNVGHFNSPFYKDQVSLFIGGKYRPQWMSLADVKKHKHSILKLRPL